ncbi:MAG: DNA polymerase III subunit delta [Spirosomataceae bacterium]
MKFGDLLKSIKKNQLAPVYFLHGSESYFLDTIAQKVIDLALPAADRGFNEWFLHGTTSQVGQVIQQCRQFPMMADKQLVVVREAQQLQDIGQKASTDLLEKYFLQPQPSTILVLLFSKTQDERKGWVKAAGKQGVLFQAKPLYERDLPPFILGYCDEKGVGVNQEAVRLLVDHIGTDLKKLTNEIDKALVNLPVGASLTGEVVEKYIGISREFNYFELQKALAEKKIGPVFRIIEAFAADPKNFPIQPFLVLLYQFFSRLILLLRSPGGGDAELASLLGVSPFFVKDYRQAARFYTLESAFHAIHVIRDIDAKSKGVDAHQVSDKELYQMLAWRLIQVK